MTTEPRPDHGTTDHGDDDGHADHVHATEGLGPPDRRAWGAGVAGLVLGLIVAAAFVIATSAP